MFTSANTNTELGAALKLKLMENYRNGVNVDTDALESAEASWFMRYLQQQKVCVCFFTTYLVVYSYAPTLSQPSTLMDMDVSLFG